MMRRIVWFFIIPALVIGLGFLWFVTYFEQVPATRYVMPEAEARHNPYLALERLMTQLGRPIVKESKISNLATLPDKGILILGQGRSHYMGPERIEHLLRWVEQGGVPDRGT